MNERPTPETDAILARLPSLYEIEEAMRDLERERDELRRELDELKAGAVHSCHDQCQRPGCVRRRVNEAMRAALDSIRGHLRKQDKSLPTAKEVVERLYAYREEAKAMREAIHEAYSTLIRIQKTDCPCETYKMPSEALAKIKPFTTATP